MPAHNQTITFIVKCSSPESRRLAEQITRKDIQLDRSLENTARTMPSGVETITTTQHRLSDYFRDIHIEGEQDNPASFKLTFSPRDDADRYWKDLMVRILGSITQAISGVSVSALRRPR